MQSNGHIENTTKEGNEFESGINEPHERVLVVDYEQLISSFSSSFPDNALLLPSTTAAKITKPKVSSSKDKSSGKRRRDETSSADTAKQLQRQATQLDKITIMLHSIQKDMKSTKGQSKLINLQLYVFSFGENNQDVTVITLFANVDKWSLSPA